MKIKMLKTMAGPLGISHVGTVMEVKEELGIALIADKAAEEIIEKQKPKGIEKAELPAADFVETAEINTRRRRRG